MTLYQLFIVEGINLKDLAAVIVIDYVWGTCVSIATHNQSWLAELDAIYHWGP